MNFFDFICQLTDLVFPAWDILNKYISSFFILFSLRPFSFRYSNSYERQILCASSILCGTGIQLIDSILTHFFSILLLPTGHNYYHISLISVIVISAFALYLYYGNCFQIMLSILLLYNLFSSFRFLFINIIYFLVSKPTTGIIWVWSEIPTCLICILLYKIIIHFHVRTDSGFSYKESIWWFTVAFFDMTVMCYIPSLGYSSLIGLIVFCVNIIFTTIVIYILLFQYSREKHRTIEQEKIIQNLNESRYYLSQLKETTAQLNEVRHELKNHVFYMEELLIHEDYSALFTYLENLKGKGLHTSSTISTGNFIIDSVINQKCAYASSLGIQVSAEATLPSDMNIDHLTLCSILGNLINNAIEASLNTSNTSCPSIQITISYFKEYLTIVVNNTVNYNVMKKNPHLLSTKKNVGNHGIGLKVVQQLIQEYDGMLTFQMKDEHTFSVSAMIKYITSHH